MNLIEITPSGFNHGAPRLVATTGAPATTRHLLRAWDEIDFGMVLVTTSGVLRHANHIALRLLAGNGPLRLVGGQVFSPVTLEQNQLRQALADAERGLRRMLHLGHGADAVTLSVVPLASDDDSGDAEPVVMLSFGKRQASESLTIDFFARTQKLTGAESAVLQGLCSGLRPKEIAGNLGVAISTVRTQINSVRTKTQTSSIRELVNRVATLPPITPAMKSTVCH